MPPKRKRVCNAEEHGMNGVICFQNLPSRITTSTTPWHEVQIRMACQRFRPHGAGRRTFHRHGVLIGLEKNGDRHHDVAYHLLSPKHYWQTKYSVNFPVCVLRERRLPAQCHHERPRTGTSHFAMRIFDHDVDISLLHPRACRYTRPYGNTRCDNHERQSKDRNREDITAIRKHWNSFMSATSARLWKWTKH